MNTKHRETQCRLYTILIVYHISRNVWQITDLKLGQKKFREWIDLVIINIMDGLSLANHRQFAKLSPCQTYSLYSYIHY